MRQAGVGPAIVIAAMAAHVSHRINGRGTADHLAASAFDATPVERRLGFREIHPIVHTPLQDAAPGKRDPQPRIAVPTAGLEQQDARTAIFC